MVAPMSDPDETAELVDEILQGYREHAAEDQADAADADEEDPDCDWPSATGARFSATNNTPRAVAENANIPGRRSSQMRCWEEKDFGNTLFPRTSLIVVSILDAQPLKSTVCPPPAMVNELPTAGLVRVTCTKGRVEFSSTTAPSFSPLIGGSYTFSLSAGTTYRYTLPVYRPKPVRFSE